MGVYNHASPVYKYDQPKYWLVVTMLIGDNMLMSIELLCKMGPALQRLEYHDVMTRALLSQEHALNVPCVSRHDVTRSNLEDADATRVHLTVHLAEDAFRTPAGGTVVIADRTLQHHTHTRQVMMTSVQDGDH